MGPAGDVRAGRVHRAGPDPVLAWPRSSSAPRSPGRRPPAARGRTPGSARLRRGPGRASRASGAAGQTKPNGSHPAPVAAAPGGSPHAGALPPRPGRSSHPPRAPGGRPHARAWPGAGRRPSRRNWARSGGTCGRAGEITSWVAVHIPDRALGDDRGGRRQGRAARHGRGAGRGHLPEDGRQRSATDGQRAGASRCRCSTLRRQRSPRPPRTGPAGSGTSASSALTRTSSGRLSMTLRLEAPRCARKQRREACSSATGCSVT